ncbi:PrcB C-terminal [Virgibacillus subterraneus]|uniref:PrcB C-terminal n=1 Tax=Virgibacillus subterraneus TaxID=621109 RepID=A0A1H8ZIM6_9BACI|nr:protease complex subunit PrcB family protein [Virgibacillus subterraneus]SEP64164.1 PrcB C-terminal [Virgibacillus subterraneus]
MERNSIRYLVLMILSILLLSGCGSGTTEDESMGGEKESTNLSFKTIKVENTPDRVQKWIQKWIQKNRSKEVEKVFNVDGMTYAIILLGQKPTGGYNVEIEQIKKMNTNSSQTDSVNTVSYEVTEPEKGSVNIQTLTYPVAIAELEGETSQSFQFSTSKEPELEGTELVAPQELTSDGKVK